MLRELRIAGKLVHTNGVARRVEVRDDDVDEGLAAVDREFEIARRGHSRREHDLRVGSFEALLHTHGLVGLLVDLLAEGLLVLAAVDVHPRAASRFYFIVERGSPLEAEALGDDPGLPSLNLGLARAVGACAGEEEEE